MHLILISRWRRPWNHIFLFSPSPKINLPATLAAKRPVFAGFGPFDFLAAGGAVYDGSHDADRSKITEGEFEGHIAFMRLGFHVATLAGEAYPQHIFVG